MTVSKSRMANLDLLRILSMLLIIFLHSIDHSGVLESAHTAPPTKTIDFYVFYGYALAQTCVNGFVLISGYFLVRSTFKWKKLLYLWAETVFYSLILRILFIVTGQREFSVTSILSCFMPILTGRYWFITIYVGLYLLSPFLNRWINAMDKKTHGLLNLLLFFLFSVWISLHPSMAGMNSGGGWGLAWFIVLYLAAAWFRLYYNPVNNPLLPLLGFFLLPALVTAALFLTDRLGIGVLRSMADNWYRYDSVPSYLASICLMLVCLNIQVPDKHLSHIITSVAPLTFGVYLIHAHADVSPWLWSTLDLPSRMNTCFPLVQISVVLLIFTVCSVMDGLRKAAVKSVATIFDKILHRLMHKESIT